MAFGRRETAILIVGDLCILAASLWVALLLRNLSVPPLGYFEANVVPFLPVFLLSLGVFYIAGLYEKQTRPIRRVMGVRVLGAQAANSAIAAILFFILPLNIAPKTILVLYLVVSVIAESLWRFFRMNREMKDSNRVPALLVSSGPVAEELFDEVNGNSRYLIRFIGRISTEGLSKDSMSDAVSAGVDAGARAVVVDSSSPAVADALPSVYGLMSAGRITFMEFSSLYEEIFDRMPLGHLGVSQLLETLPKHHVLYDVAKRLFDTILALLAAVVAVPFIAIAALLLSLSGAPFIFNERIGKNGRIFRIIKLRTMLFNDHGDPELQKKNRVTALGRVLRKSRIDELPQLYNVIAGHLSFIGPRPELPKIAEIYEREIPQYQMRHLISPGLSGWAQIHDYDAPRGSADVEKTRRKLSFDLYYLKHRSFGLDLAIAVKTLRTLFAFTGA